MPQTLTSSELLERDKAIATPAIYLCTDIAFARGEGVFLFDYERRRYYDIAAWIAVMNVGHCYPRGVHAIRVLKDSGRGF